MRPIGHFQHATIALRVLSFEDVSIDQDFFQHRIENAVELRKKIGLFDNGNTICRLVHGEGDSLPGLIIDYYNNNTHEKQGSQSTPAPPIYLYIIITK